MTETSIATETPAEKPQIVARDERNRWDWYRVTPREMMLDTRYARLNAECIGVLTRLTWLAWELGAVTSNVSDLAVLMHLDEDEVERALPRLLEVRIVEAFDEGRLWLPDVEAHLRELITEAEERSERSRRAGEASAAARRGNTAPRNIPF